MLGANLRSQQLRYMHYFLTAVFKKDTKQKNQKKAEAKKRKAEQQEQQEPVDDNMAVTSAQDNLTTAVNLLQQSEQPAQPGLSHLQAQMQLPPPGPEHHPSTQVDNDGPKVSAAEQGM